LFYYYVRAGDATVGTQEIAIVFEDPGLVGYSDAAMLVAIAANQKGIGQAILLGSNTVSIYFDF